MINGSLLPYREVCPRGKGCRAFSLVEVVLALAICGLALVVMLGLLSEGLAGDMDSREQIQAANLASLIVTPRRFSPTNTFSTDPYKGTNILLPPLNQAYPATATTNWVNSSGQVVTSLAQADYTLSYQVGTNAANPNVALIYLRFTWPPGANTNIAEGHYEQTTQILMP